MPKSSLVANADIKSIYAGSWFHNTLWAYVSAQRRCGISLAEAVDDFIDFFGTEELEKRTLQKIYDRKNKEYQTHASGIREDMNDLMELEADKVRAQGKAKLMELKERVGKLIEEFKM